MYFSHIEEMDQKRGQLLIPEFQKGLQWYNSPPLLFNKELNGKIVVLDFWTYCCINCIHVVPELSALESIFKNKPVVFIGVHSAKFENEREGENIRQALLRYEIEHPVVNDSSMTMWQILGIHSWPSFVVIGPHGNLLASFSGEGVQDTLERFIESALTYYAKDLDYSPIPLSLEKDKGAKASCLLFPAKLAIDEENERLFISDSNHNRIVVTTLDGKFLFQIGSGTLGLLDGSFDECALFRPQGICYSQDRLFIADTENHVIREVNLLNHKVITILGTGSQGRDFQGGRVGIDQEISSPWDVTLSDNGKVLYIAMAGTHQIWSYNLDTGVGKAFAGSGREENYNSNSLLKSAFAQPSGLSLANEKLFIADSESSSIRAIDFTAKSVDSLAGGDTESPRNLFSFGDTEGFGDSAKFQHPLGVIYLPTLQQVAVADTYNHRIKLLNPTTRQVKNWIGTGTIGDKNGSFSEATFWEPSGFAYSTKKNLLFVADCNNHQVRCIDLFKNEVTTLNIESVV